MKQSLQDQVFFAGTISLAATPISRAARHLATSARAVCALMWIIQSLWLGRSVYTLFYPRPAFPITKSCLYRSMLANPSVGHAFRYFTRRGNSFRQRRRAGDNRARSVHRPCSQNDPRRLRTRASEDRLNLALHQQEMLTREMNRTGSKTFSPSRSAWFPSVQNRPLRRRTWPRPYWAG